MRRAAAVLLNDVRLQVRYGLYGVSLVMVLIWGLLLGALARGTDLSPALLLPLLVTTNMIITTFYFMAALLLFEKSEGVLPAIVITPLTGAGYLVSKSVSLALLATAETLLIAAFLFGARAVSLSLLAASFLLGVLYALAGFLTVVRFASLNEFLMPSVPVVMLLLVPLLAHFGLTTHLAVAWHPAHTILRIMWGDLSAAPLAAAWCLLALWVARREFHRFVVRA